MRLGRFETLRVPSFDKGGTVPGPLGRPSLAVVHGGEEVQPPETIRLGGPAGGTTAHFEVTVDLDVGSIGGDVTLDEVERKVGDSVESAVRKAGERYLAGFGSG